LLGAAGPGHRYCLYHTSANQKQALELDVDHRIELAAAQINHPENQIEHLARQIESVADQTHTGLLRSYMVKGRRRSCAAGSSKVRALRGVPSLELWYGVDHDLDEGKQSP
jgi:hypothetical protein